MKCRICGEEMVVRFLCEQLQSYSTDPQGCVDLNKGMETVSTLSEEVEDIICGCDECLYYFDEDSGRIIEPDEKDGLLFEAFEHKLLEKEKTSKEN